jgi:hypothetical protein
LAAILKNTRHEKAELISKFRKYMPEKISLPLKLREELFFMQKNSLCFMS